MGSVTKTKMHTEMGGISLDGKIKETPPVLQSREHEDDRQADGQTTGDGWTDGYREGVLSLFCPLH